MPPEEDAMSWDELEYVRRKGYEEYKPEVRPTKAEIKRRLK